VRMYVSSNAMLNYLCVLLTIGQMVVGSPMLVTGSNNRVVYVRPQPDTESVMKVCPTPVS
jgi:hypothetical protein